MSLENLFSSGNLKRHTIIKHREATTMIIYFQNCAVFEIFNYVTQPYAQR